MRLLKVNNTGEFSLTKDLLVSDDIPRYAILSHTWGADTEEVSFKDMMDGTGKRKTVYDKIRFFGEQAGRDGLQYFWINTCCIDKPSSSELQEAINSMFRWYRDAAKCSVYLADVKSSQLPWELSFRKNRWFTRGWTLQELVAPVIVEFFSEEGEQLGNKKALERHIHEVTGIPVKALRGSPLCDFSIPERMLWAEKRETTRKEDKAYSLLGIFDVYMPLIYGEGRENAFKRLREEMDNTAKGSFAVTVAVTLWFFTVWEELVKPSLPLRTRSGTRTINSAIFWLNIKDEDSLKQSFAKVAKQILREHPSASRLSSVDIKENIDEVVDAVKAWYDNPKLAGNTDPAAVDIREYLPESYQGSVVITTRSSEVRLIYEKSSQDVADEPPPVTSILLMILILTTSQTEQLSDNYVPTSRKDDTKNLLQCFLKFLPKRGRLQLMKDIEFSAPDCLRTLRDYLMGTLIVPRKYS
ncbi:HET domain containing protein [Elaphomyces granulatus]